jgi:hypothetical protein
MGVPIDSSDVLVKIARAEVHLSDLDRQMAKWLAKNKVRVVHNHDPKTGIHELIAQPLPDIPRQWGAVLGDFGYNLRAALEYMVELLVLANGNTPKRTNQFPIVSDRRDAHLIAVQLDGVHPDAIAEITKRQPYERRNGEDRDVLEIVGSLANVDKHHRLYGTAIITEAVGRRQFKFTTPIAGTFDWLIQKSFGMPIANAPVIGFRFTPFETTIKVDVNRHVVFPIGIEFRNGEPFRRDVLPNCVTEVRAIFEALGPWLGLAA